MKGNRLVRFGDFVGRNWSSVGSGVGSAAILFITLLITVDVLGRALGIPTQVAHELSGYMMVGVVFLGLAHTQRKGKHIKISLITDRLSQRKRQQTEIAALAVAAVCVGGLVWYTSMPVMSNYTKHITSLTFLHVPLWIPYLLVPLGLFMLAIELTVETFRKIQSFRTNQEPEIAQTTYSEW
jgi:TRAP-type C4-dicarboxylate transport system permease small subunit|tara:strand:+ start:627 stop:1172 length:546 start_codon:yes stop_codon:yes gene_type:complete